MNERRIMQNYAAILLTWPPGEWPILGLPHDFELRYMTYFGQCDISRFNTTRGLKGICMEWLDPFVFLLSPQKGQAQVVTALSVWDTE